MEADKEKTVRIGIIGAGRFAATHMEAFAQISEAQVVAFMRRDATALKEMQTEWSVAKGYTDHTQMLADPDIDAIDIITPTDSLCQYALDAIAAGKHVLCEKPLALTAADVQRMLDAADDAGVIHATNFNQRGRTTVGRMKRYIDADYVGRPYHTSIWWGMSQVVDVRPQVLSWRFLPEQGGGTVYELVHVFDMARFINGPVARIVSLLNTAEPRRATADMPDGMEVTVPDSSAFMMEHVNGSYTIAHTSFVSRGTSSRDGPRVEVSGEYGRIVTDGVHGLMGSSGDNGQMVQLDPGPAYPQPYEQFVQACLTGDQSLVDTGFEAGYEAARLVDAAYESYRERRWIEVDDS